jgi:hypothetical protein
MQLGEGLEVLVQDWIDLHEDGGTNLSIEEVVGKLDRGLALSMTPQMKTAQISNVIESYLRQNPAALESAERFMAQFDTPGDLLEEIDLDCFVCDLGAAEDDDL